MAPAWSARTVRAWRAVPDTKQQKTDRGEAGDPIRSLSVVQIIKCEEMLNSSRLIIVAFNDSLLIDAR
jgi:hypothetical protein